MKHLFFLIVLILVGNVLGQSKNNSDETVFQKVDKSHKKDLIKASRKIKVPILKDAKFKDNEAELRIWKINYFLTESFILRRKNDQWKARYVLFDNQDRKFRRNAFLQPKNGWESLNQYLKDNKLGFDLQLTPEEEKFPLHPDANFFLIEAREGEKYNMYWYIMNTRIEDGKKVQNLCDKISEEFNLDDFVCKYPLSE